MEKLKRFSSGAMSSGAALRFDLVPRNFLQRVAVRFGLGEAKYGERAYRKGLRDRAFIIDRLNHLQTHMQAFIAPQNVEEYFDDNLGAIGWAAAFLCEVEADRIGSQILAKIRAERGQNIQAIEKSAAADLVIAARGGTISPGETFIVGEHARGTVDPEMTNKAIASAMKTHVSAIRDAALRALIASAKAKARKPKRG